MVKHEPKPCEFCGDAFVPHPKVGPRQMACKKSTCKQKRIKRTRRQWYEKNPGYNYDNVKSYRQAHPTYQKQWRQRQKKKLPKLKAPISPALHSGVVSQRHSPIRPAGEIQNQLNVSKTKTHIDLHHETEIQNQLSISFSIALPEFLQSLSTAQRREIQNQLSA